MQLQFQKHYMPHIVRKPVNMTTKRFATRISKFDDYLLQFLSATEDGKAPTKLEDNKIVNLSEFGIPTSWQTKMIKHNIDYVTSTNKNFVNFCNRMEAIEHVESHTVTQTTTTKINQTLQGSQCCKALNFVFPIL